MLGGLCIFSHLLITTVPWGKGHPISLRWLRLFRVYRARGDRDETWSDSKGMLFLLHNTWFCMASVEFHWSPPPQSIWTLFPTAVLTIQPLPLKSPQSHKTTISSFLKAGGGWCGETLSDFQTRGNESGWSQGPNPNICHDKRTSYLHTWMLLKTSFQKAPLGLLFPIYPL